MKHWISILTLVCLLCVPCSFALAQADAQLDACLREAYPQAQSAQMKRQGDVAAAVFTIGGVNRLCVLEKHDGQWRITIDTAKALFQEQALPEITLDSHNRLTWSHDLGSFVSSRNDDGSWGNVAQVVEAALSDDDQLVNEIQWSVDGLITHTRRVYGKEGSLLRSDYTESFPAPWLADVIRLVDFDVTRFPVFTCQEYDGQWPEQAFVRDAAAYFLPDYTYVDGSLADGNLQFLMDKPDGTRVFVGCTYAGDVSLCESAPLPPNTIYGVENFTTSLGINRLCVTLQYNPQQERWSVWLVSGGEDEIVLGVNALYGASGNLYFGSHPWSDIRTIDWSTLPSTLSEAVEHMDCTGWAVVVNPNPDDRLHLRKEPDQNASSLGKYYNGTPVQVLGTQGDWSQVDLLGQTGWMMTKFLSFPFPCNASLAAMPIMQFKDGTAELYPTRDLSNGSRRLDNNYGMCVVGVVGDEWYHVWFPRTGETGYIRQSELTNGNG